VLKYISRPSDLILGELLVMYQILLKSLQWVFRTDNFMKVQPE
jgi:hypothetical protein